MTPAEKNTTCFSVKAALEQSLLDGEFSNLAVDDARALEHLQRCPVCRQEKEVLEDLGARLHEGLSTLEAAVPALSEQRLDDTLEALRAVSPERILLSRLRRGLRLVLWSALYGFTLVAAAVLLTALYRALSGTG